MDDREIRDLMGSLRPRRSPRNLDGRVLAEAELAARTARSRRRFRVGLGLAGFAAAAVLLVAIGWRLAGTGESPVDLRRESGRAVAEAPPPGEPLETLASAKATLLELRIERLRRMALASGEAEETLTKLDSLRREVETIEDVYLEAVPASFAVERETDGFEEESEDENQSRLDPEDDGGEPRRGGADRV
jgi:hypothetical protein